MIWLAIPALLLVALIIVLPPLLRPAGNATRGGDLAIYRDQLKELDADIARGLITETEAEAARTEIKRRILALPKAPAETAHAGPSRTTAIAVAITLAALSLATYLPFGKPSLPAHLYSAAAEQSSANEQLLAQVDAMIEKVKAQLAAEPNDPTGWRLLGTTYVKIGRTKDGIDALARALTLTPEDASLRAQYGEALVQDAQGTVTPGALAAFDEALKRDTKDPRARFYKGLALQQAGQEKAALDAWIAIIKDGPADADWLPAIRAQATDLATKLKLDPKTVVP